MPQRSGVLSLTMPITVTKTDLEGVLLIEPTRYADARGWFSESWSERDFAAAGIEAKFVQDNHSVSQDANTLRGLHCQAPPKAQEKLVRCTRGAIRDVIVDFRLGSAQFGRWTIIDLDEHNGRQVFIPKGFLHGFVTLVPDTHVQYRTSEYYAPECEMAVRWDSVGVDWGLSALPILSDRDHAATPFTQLQSPFTKSVSA